ncbi:MAG: thioredoxin family protein [Patescibacteria group bacterium]|jgi:thiol-disulfide isomerase/thioredoxin
MKKYIFFAGIILFSSLLLTGCGTKEATNTGTTKGASTQNTNQTQAVTADYFDDSSPVMFFYSESCGWCTKEKTVLAELAKEGYRVKPMDVGKNQNYWQDYNISGTPTFIGKDGQKETGYKEKDALKSWLDTQGAKIK